MLQKYKTFYWHLFQSVILMQCEISTEVPLMLACVWPYTHLQKDTCISVIILYLKVSDYIRARQLHLNHFLSQCHLKVQSYKYGNILPNEYCAICVCFCVTCFFMWLLQCRVISTVVVVTWHVLEIYSI